MCLQAILLREGPVSHPVSPPFPCSSQVITDHVVLMAHPPFSGGGSRGISAAASPIPTRDPKNRWNWIFHGGNGKRPFSVELSEETLGPFSPLQFHMSEIPSAVVGLCRPPGVQKGTKRGTYKARTTAGFPSPGPCISKFPPPSGGILQIRLP